MKIDIRRLEVMYNNKLVGYLEMIDSYRVAFQYAREWISTGFSISPLSLPLSDKVYISESPYFNGLFGVFYDSLPDGWGEYLLRRKLLKEGVNFDRLTPLSRLSLVDDTGLGGLQYVPTQVSNSDNINNDLDELLIKIKSEQQNQADKVNLDKLYKLGGASGGARPKVHLRIDDIDWIIKFQALNDPSDIGKEEHIANQFAQTAGINTADFKLFNSQITKGFFGSKRFDRIGNEKIHVISLAAILETTHRISNLDYIHLFQVIARISVDKDDMYEAFKRMSFNVLYGNKDDHSKNHSFIYDEKQKGYVLSKAYDITKTLHQLEHEMTVNGSGNPTINDLMEIQKIFKLSKDKCTRIIDDIKLLLIR